METKRVKGTVKWFDNRKGYGFITSEDGNEYFVHYSSLVKARRYFGCDKGNPVEFDVVEGEKGPQAVNVSVQPSHGAPIVDVPKHQ